MLFCASVAPSTVLVVAPPTLYRHGLLATLQDAWPTLELTITTDADQVPALVHRQSFALLVLDSSASSQGLPVLINRIRAVRPQQPVLVLTAQRLACRYRQEFAHTATMLLPRHSTPQELVQAIQPCLVDTTGCAQVPLPTVAIRQLGPPTPFSRREM